MPSQWSVEQVLALAPDDSGARAARGLARASQWTVLGRSDAALWGTIQGSGEHPYRVRIDLTEPAFKCSCPSRKFPCKHGLGLLLILAEHADAIPEGQPPDWVAEWLAARTQRQETQAAKAAATREVDVEERAKRAASRQSRVEDGIAALALWLQDLVRQGLGAAQAQPSAFWESTAARLVDAQASGLARLVRRLGEAVTSGAGWQGRTLAGIGRIHLLCEAYGRLAALPAEVQADVRTAIGWTVAKEELLSSNARHGDTWCVLAQRVDREEQLRVQRTWLLGVASRRLALILQFAAGSQGFEQSFRTGAQFASELVYYPSAVPLRGMLVGERGDPIEPPIPLPAAVALGAALAEYARALTRQPWLETWPMYTGGLVPVVFGETGEPILCDGSGRQIPIVDRFGGVWHLLAISGGAPLDVFGEWDGDALRPLSAVSGGRVFTFMQTESATALTRVA